MRFTQPCIMMPAAWFWAPDVHVLSRTSDSRLIVGIANMPGPGDTLFGASSQVSVDSMHRLFRGLVNPHELSRIDRIRGCRFEVAGNLRLCATSLVCNKYLLVF